MLILRVIAQNFIHSLCQISKEVLKWKYDMTVKLCKSVITMKILNESLSHLDKKHKLTTNF